MGEKLSLKVAMPPGYEKFREPGSIKENLREWVDSSRQVVDADHASSSRPFDQRGAVILVDALLSRIEALEARLSHMPAE